MPDHSARNVPGDCSFGPSLAFIGVKFDGPICPDWVHQPQAASPANLHQAQLERRHALLAAGGGGNSTSIATFQLAGSTGQ